MIQGSCNHGCFDYIYLSCVLFLQNILQDKPMSVVSTFMIGNYLCQPVDVVAVIVK